MGVSDPQILPIRRGAPGSTAKERTKSMPYDETLAVKSASCSAGQKASRQAKCREETVRRPRLPAQRQHLLRRVEGVSHPPARRRRGPAGARRGTHPAVRHHRQADARLGDGRAGRLAEMRPSCGGGSPGRWSLQTTCRRSKLSGDTGGTPELQRPAWSLQVDATRTTPVAGSSACHTKHPLVLEN